MVSTQLTNQMGNFDKILVLFYIMACDIFLILKIIYFAGYANCNTIFEIRENNADLLDC